MLQLLMMKKVARALDEMAKNEELMAGIMAATQDDGIGAEDMEGAMEEQDYEQDDYEPEPQSRAGGQVRLNTIGEEEQDEMTAGKGVKGAAMSSVAGSKMAGRGSSAAPQEDDYQEDDYEENGNDDYEF